LTEIQTKMRMLTKRLEDGSNEIRALSEEMKDWSSKEQLLLKARHSRGISFIK
jgi:cell division protein FtsL